MYLSICQFEPNEEKIGKYDVDMASHYSNYLESIKFSVIFLQSPLTVHWESERTHGDETHIVHLNMLFPFSAAAHETAQRNYYFPKVCVCVLFMPIRGNRLIIT